MFLSLLEKRRSIRRYKKKKIEPEKLERLIEAALRAPSSMGNDPWEFIVVTEPDLLANLSKAKEHGSQFLRNAALAIVVCADPDKSQVWVEDASIAAIFIHLAAESLGLGSCWVQIRERMHDQTKTAQSYVSQLLNLPENMRVECVIGIGYPDEEKAPHGKEKLQFEKVHVNAYGNMYRK